MTLLAFQLNRIGKIGQYLSGIALIFILSSWSFAAWEPPIGIPSPEFGIEEVHIMYVGKTYDYDGTLGPYSDAGNGPFSHYVDNTDSNATDSNNPFGSVDKPRSSMPESENIKPGAVIEVHGGPYMIGYFVFTAQGTKEQPVFFRGVSETQRPVFTGGSFYIASYYLIVENIALENQSVGVRPVYEDREAHHVAIRNCFSYDNEGGGFSNVSYLETKEVHDIVYYNNHLYGGNFDTSASGTDIPEDDAIGVHMGDRSRNVWVVDNHIHSYSGDGVGAGHAAKYTTKNYYIGRNLIHHCAENAIDLKEVENIVISQNVMHSFYGQSDGSDGTATVVHYGPDLSPKNVWFLFNEIYNCKDKALQVGGDQEYDVYYIGNIVHDVHNTENTACGYRTWNSRKVFLVGNTFYNVDNGINSQVEGDSTQLVMYNNIIAGTSDAGYHVIMSGSSHLQNSIVSYNLFHQPAGDVKIKWGSPVYTVSEFQTATGKGEGCLEADPLFTDAANNIFSLQKGSLAINAGVEHAVYQLYQDTFGVDIRVDYIGTKRPQDSVWDIGAYEYTDDIGIGDLLSSNNIGGNDIIIKQKNSGVIITYRAHATLDIRIKIYDLMGRQVAILTGRALQGDNTIHWNGNSDSGSPAGAGCYIINLLGGKQEINQRFVINR